MKVPKINRRTVNCVCVCVCVCIDLWKKSKKWVDEDGAKIQQKGCQTCLVCVCVCCVCVCVCMASVCVPACITVSQVHIKKKL
jgi:hypothetical protein